MTIHLVAPLHPASPPLLVPLIHTRIVCVVTVHLGAARAHERQAAATLRRGRSCEGSGRKRENAPREKACQEMMVSAHGRRSPVQA